MSKEFRIPFRDGYALSVKMRPGGDVEMRLWAQEPDGSWTSLRNGFFIPEIALAKVEEALHHFTELVGGQDTEY